MRQWQAVSAAGLTEYTDLGVKGAALGLESDARDKGTNAMRTVLCALLLFLTTSSMTLAGEEGLTVTYFVQNVTRDVASKSTTLTLEVELTNIGRGVMSQPILRLVSADGSENIDGEILLTGQLGAGQTRTAVGIFTLPSLLDEGLVFDALLWKITFRDDRGGERTAIVRSSRK